MILNWPQLKASVKIHGLQDWQTPALIYADNFGKKMGCTKTYIGLTFSTNVYLEISL